MKTFGVERTIDGKLFSKDQDRFKADNIEIAELLALAKYGECEVFECNPNDDILISDDLILDIIIKRL